MSARRARGSRGALALAVVLASVGVARGAAAQRPSADAFRPAPDADGVITLVGAHTPGHLRGSLAVYADYTLDLATAPTPGAADPVLVGHRLTAHVAGQLGLGRRGVVVVDVPAVPIQAGGRVDDGASGIPRAATGDLFFGGRARIVGELPEVPGQVPVGLGLAVAAGATVPMGRQSALAGEGQLTFELGLLADYYLAPGLGFTVGAGYLLRPYDRALGAAEIDDALRFGVGMKMPLPKRPKLVFRAEVRGELGFHGPATHLYEADGGLAYRFGDVSLLAAAGAGFGQGYGSPDFRGLVGVAWSPRVRDADGDGIPDERDECPRLAEDLDGFEDDDGCEDPDNDQDFVLDTDDACPDDPADPERDADLDGCTDE